MGYKDDLESLTTWTRFQVWEPINDKSNWKINSGTASNPREFCKSGNIKHPLGLSLLYELMASKESVRCTLYCKSPPEYSMDQTAYKSVSTYAPSYVEAIVVPESINIELMSGDEAAELFDELAGASKSKLVGAWLDVIKAASVHDLPRVRKPVTNTVSTASYMLDKYEDMLKEQEYIFGGLSNTTPTKKSK